MRSLEHFPNLVTMFFARAAQKGDAPLLWAKRDGAWTPLSWAEVARQVASLAVALRAQGLRGAGAQGRRLTAMLTAACAESEHSACEPVRR